MPLGSSSAAPVMRPGPSRLARFCSDSSRGGCVSLRVGVACGGCGRARTGAVLAAFAVLAPAVFRIAAPLAGKGAAGGLCRGATSQSVAGLCRDELQREAVVAVALAGRRRAVVEEVALVAAAAHAVVFGARHDHLVVDLEGHRARQRFPEARPAGAALKLGRGREQRQLAAGTDEAALALLVVERARARGLGAFEAKDLIR